MRVRSREVFVVRGALTRMRRRLRRLGDRGMSTAEYAVGTIAAVGFAAVLHKVVTSGPILQAMQSVIQKALKVGF